MTDTERTPTQKEPVASAMAGEFWAWLTRWATALDTVSEHDGRLALAAEVRRLRDQVDRQDATIKALEMQRA
ncbi:MAG: hypothetical protein COB37_00315 [Kordiimonadales bacterium]|nr:MAG: hypothetical protein COB37_00315 [Kordiimonadales bacterium]